ncbi:hypothetical protein RQP46_002161 [Phenoliferia psychrophenolica]
MVIGMSSSWRAGALLASAATRRPGCTCRHLSLARQAARPQVPAATRLLSTTARALSKGPAAAYDEQVASGLIKNDEHQRGIVAVLQSIHDELAAYDPPPLAPLVIQPPRKKPMFSLARILGDELFQPPPPPSQIPTIPPNVPKGLYLFGSVGCGKSFLMDLFYANLPEKYASSKRRVHFHAFMMDVHQRGHRMKAKLGGSPEADWIVHAARDLAEESQVLCFDEFQVTDIADAMILRRLMESLMGYGVVAVMTSNRAPDELYKNGIQREQFVPCIDLIKERFKVQCLDSDIDYRKMPRALSKVYFHPQTPENTSEINKLFDALTEHEPVVEHRPLQVWGRDINVPLSSSNVARFSFDDLCGKPLSAADYLEITKTFETIFLTGVPLLGLDTKDMARRFILFIDAAYEAKTKLFVLSDPPIESVFSDEKKAAGAGITDHQRSVMDDLGLSADTVGASSIFTGEEEIFAFARAVSRLNEMSSVQWSQSTSKGPTKA